MYRERGLGCRPWQVPGVQCTGSHEGCSHSLCVCVCVCVRGGGGGYVQVIHKHCKRNCIACRHVATSKVTGQTLSSKLFNCLLNCP